MSINLKEAWDVSSKIVHLQERLPRSRMGPFLLLVVQCRISMCQKVLCFQTSVFLVAGQENSTPLHLAVKSVTKLAIMNVLIDSGAFLDAVDKVKYKQCVKFLYFR